MLSINLGRIKFCLISIIWDIFPFLLRIMVKFVKTLWGICGLAVQCVREVGGVGVRRESLTGVKSMRLFLTWIHVFCI